MRTDTQKWVSRRISSDRMDEKSCVDLVESINSIVLRWNADFIITYINHYGERFLGYDRDELAGRSVIGTIVPETSGEGEDMTELMSSIFRHPERYVNNENENFRKDCSRVWVSWTNHAVIGSDGRVAEIMSIGNDITDRKRMEKELRKARDEQKRRVFTFMQGYTAKPGRRGLGLCLVKTLVEHFHGHVWVENRITGNYRQGAKFVVVLPAA